jgi:hypothetical protein
MMPRALVSFVLYSTGALLALASVPATPLSLARHLSVNTALNQERFAPVVTAVSMPAASSELGRGDAGDASNTVPGGDVWRASQQIRASPALSSSALPVSPTRNAVLTAASVPYWFVVDSPNADSEVFNVLNDVTCVSASDCWTVGAYVGNASYRTSIEHWDGSSWRIVTSPNPDGAWDSELAGVVCASASDCWAVGFYLNGKPLGPSSVYRTLIEHWDGNVWTIVNSPNTDATHYNLLQDVTCTSTSQCWAVGYVLNSDAITGSQFYQTLVEHWDGTSWTIVSSPNTTSIIPLSRPNNFLRSVACTSASDCWATGDAAGATLIEHWDGNSWTIVTSPSPGSGSWLVGVTCTSAANCWAAGYYQGGTLIEHWDGTSWAVFGSPTSGTLNGVTCASASDCLAVGYYVNSDQIVQTLVEHWDGTSWAVANSANAGSATLNILNGVACAAASDCWAVGRWLHNDGINNGIDQTLTEHWNGAAWAVVASPSISAPQINILNDVTCVTASDCWVVGFAQIETHLQNLIEHWNGAAWTIINSPNTAPRDDDILESVTCASGSDCWAVGYALERAAGNIYRTLIEHYDGATWTIVNSPNTTSTESNFLFGVTCTSRSNCWAAGRYANATDQTYQTLVEQWNGSAWSIVSSPNINATQHDSSLLGVTCVSTSDCWAVGSDYNIQGNLYQTLIERWNGTAWTIVSSPNSASNENNLLNSVTCTSASDCMAVGVYINASSNNQTLIEHWNGSAWSIVSSPNSALTEDNSLSGVTCVMASDCWAVGVHYDGNSQAYQTLIEHWDNTSWSIVTSPNKTYSGSRDNGLEAVTCASASDCWAVGEYYLSLPATLTEHYGPLPPVPTSVVSRKTHGGAGIFDVDLPLTGARGIECRGGGASGDYHVFVTFPNAVTFNSASITSGTGTVSNSSGSGTPAITVNLTGVTNAQTITLTLYGLTDGTNTGDIGVRMGVLIGDVDASGRTDSGDVTQVRNKTVSIPDQQTFRFDVNTTGRIDAGDVTVTRNASVTVLP